MIASKFKVGDRVYASFHGYGTVTKICEDKCVYPINVHWDDSDLRYVEEESSFTEDGYLTVYNKTDELCITVVEDKEEKVMANDEKFKVGDFVYSPFSGVGKIIRIDANKELEYPILVHWIEEKDFATLDYDFFKLDGSFFSDRGDINRDIMPIEDVDLEFKEKAEETVERMEDALNKKVEDAVNPAHYKVEGLPDAIDIINHLMHREQYEGFLWGNILKYAYRFGRKGDKAETAGKIAWYATQLRELEEDKRK